MGLVSWICQLCGGMCCLTCETSVPQCDRCMQRTMVLASTISLPELRRLHQDLKCAPQDRFERPETSDFLARMIEAALNPMDRSIPVIEGECSDVEFETIWSRALPLVVRGAPGLLYDWSPTGISRFLGHDPCAIVDCETDSVTRTTVNAFLEDLKESKTDAPILKLKASFFCLHFIVLIFV